MINRSNIGAFFFLFSFPWFAYGMNYTQANLFHYLEQLPDTPDKITIQSEAINLTKPSLFSFAKDWAFPNIAHLNLIVNGPLTLHYALTAPTLSLEVKGLLTIVGVLAATHGPLTVSAYAIDGRDAKLYGKGPTLIESTQGDITIGDFVWGIDKDIRERYITYTSFNQPLRLAKNTQHAEWLEHQDRLNKIPMSDHFYSVKQSNGAYVASDNILTLRSADNIFLKHCTLMSSSHNNLNAYNKIQNVAGKISSQGTISINANVYDHIREEFAYKQIYGVIAQYVGSGPAILESLGDINFFIKNKIYNLAGSIRSGKNINLNGSPLSIGQNPFYIEEPQNLILKNYALTPVGLTFALTCITQAGENIIMNFGDFKITGSMNAGAIAIKGKTGTFVNSDSLCTTILPTEPKIINVTEHIQQEAQKPGIYQLAADGSVQTEFPLGEAYHPKEKYMVLLERESEQLVPNLWKNIFNPLSSINLELFAQRLISQYTGKIYQGNCSTLWKNAGKWRKDNQDIMHEEDLQHLQQSMLINQIGTTAEGNEQLNTVLCIAPNDVNPYQSPGDMVSGSFSCITEGNQTHLNDRIVATGPEGIALESTGGNINLQTQSYTVVSQTHDSTTVEQIAMPQQQLIAPAGPIAVHADQSVSRVGTAMHAGTTIDEQADHGSVTKNPLVLQKRVETVHRKKGFWSSSTRVETNTTHSALPCETQAGTLLHDKASARIQSVASRDSAGQTIIYEAPHTHIEGLLIANRSTSSTQTSGIFTDTATNSSKETPFAIPAQIQAPTIQFLGDSARINANIYATELHDETEQGIQFVAKIAQMLCSEQKLVSSPLCEVDCGYEAGQEVMIQPMLLVEKIVRLKDTGCMSFESAIIDKNRTEIIGKFVETTYQLKQWQRNWNNVSQVISDEALVVIALAVTFLTQGMGTELLSSVLQNITAATGMQLSAAGVVAVNAGFSAVCGSATASVLKTGDPINTVRQQLSPAQLKSVAFTMASAGLCSQLGSVLDINMEPGMKTFSQHVQEQSVRTAVDGLLSITLNNGSPDAVLRDGLKQISFKAIAAHISNEICASYMHEMGKQAAQTMVGGLSGFAQDNTRAGFVAGATGSFTAQTVGALLTADAHAIAQDAVAHLKAKGIPATPENVDRSIVHIVHEKIKIAKIVASSVAALTHQNITIAVNAAMNTVDNNSAIRAQLAASAEYQALLVSASQALVPLYVHQEKTVIDLDHTHRVRPKKVRSTQQKTKQSSPDDAAHDLTLFLLQQSTQKTIDPRIVNYALDNRTNDRPRTSVKRSPLFDRIVNPKRSPFIEATSAIIRVSFINAVNGTIDTFAMIPNPLGMACFAAGSSRDVYNGVITPAEIVYNAALTLAFLKGVQLTAKGVKVVYQKGKGMIKNITDKIENRFYQRHYAEAQRRFAEEGRIPFVENPRAGHWTDATMTGDLVLLDHSAAKTHYELTQMFWPRNQAAPFNVVGHGSPHSIRVQTQDIHRLGLSQTNRLRLQEKGFVDLNAIQLARLIRTSPTYQENQHINLFSCLCGKKSNGLASQLAKHMKVPVSAASKNVVISARAEGFEVKNSILGIDNLGTIKTFYPKDDVSSYRWILLSLIPALVLTADEGPRQEKEIVEVVDRMHDLFFEYDFSD